MSWEIIVGVTAGIITLGLTIALQVIARMSRVELVQDRVLATAYTTEAFYEVLGRLERLETGVALEAIPEKAIDKLADRLARVEQTIEPFRSREPGVTTLECQFILFEVDRLVRDLKADLTRQQREQEATLEHRFSSFRTIFTVSLTVIGLILSMSLPALFYLASRGG